MEHPLEYRREMNALAFSPEQKARLAERVAKAAAETPSSSHRPMRRLAATAAVAAVVVAASCGAVASGFVGNVFDAAFGTAKTEVVNKIGRPIAAGATSNGVSVTADAVIGDRYNACIVYTVRRTNGAPLGLPAGAAVGGLSFDTFGSDLQSSPSGGEGGATRVSWFTASKSDANAIQFVEDISSDRPLRLGTVHAVFKNLRYYNESTQKRVQLCNGEWKFSFSVNYEDSSASLPAGQTFTRQGIGFRITEVSVSPVGIRVAYQANREAGMKEDFNGSGGGALNSQMQAEDDRCFDVPVVITKKDGSTLDMTGTGGTQDAERGKTFCVKSGVFRDIIPLDEMKSITVGGVEIPVNAK